MFDAYYPEKVAGKDTHQNSSHSFNDKCKVVECVSEEEREVPRELLCIDLYCTHSMVTDT